ncbi:MAG: hypothetical protein IT438_07615 [Phycisphaerales bacterium]|nr:hypothetical protein [Phycisphaerales bacterium]
MRLSRLLLIAGGIAALASPSFAAIHVLSDRNSVVRVDDATSAGMHDWVVDGTDHLFQQWFWFRVSGDTQERQLNSLPLIGSFATDTNPFHDTRPDTLSLLYAAPGIEIQPTYTLRGGQTNSNASDVGEQIAIHNTGNQTLNISFFQYCDFDINGTPSGDTGEIVGSMFNTARQSDGVFGMSEVVVTPAPSRYEVNTFPNIVTRLDDGLVTDLANTVGPQSGDLTWAFQWDLVIAPGGTVIISKDKGIIPTPGAAALLALGGLVGLRRRR